MRRLLQRATLVGLGGYVVSLFLIGYEAVSHPESFVHTTPLESLGLNAILRTGLFLVMAAGAALALAIFRSRSSDRSATWFFSCGAIAYLFAWMLPTIPIVLERCPAGEVCNPADWGAALDLLRILLPSFVATAVLVRLPFRPTRTS